MEKEKEKRKGKRHVHSINASPSHAPINASQSTHPPFTHDHSPPTKPTVSLFPTLPLTQTRPFVTSHAPPQILLSFSPLPHHRGGWVPPSTNHQRWGPPAHYGDGVGRDKCLFLVVSFTFSWDLFIVRCSSFSEVFVPFTAARESRAGPATCPFQHDSAVYTCGGLLVPPQQLRVSATKPRGSHRTKLSTIFTDSWLKRTVYDSLLPGPFASCIFSRWIVIVSVITVVIQNFDPSRRLRPSELSTFFLFFIFSQSLFDLLF